MQLSNNYTADQYYCYMYFTNLHAAKRNRDSHLQQELAKALHLQIQNSC